MRIVMPIFDFVNESAREFIFGDGTYALRRFDSEAEVPQGLPGFSKMDLEYLKLEQWALVAENPDLKAYQEQINLLLLSFKIHTLGRPFIKYRLCREDISVCSSIEERMSFILPQKSPRQIGLDQLKLVDLGFQRLLEMYSAENTSKRTHNAIYFMYGAYFVGRHWAYVFVLLTSVLEALFSKEAPGGATKTICSRVSAFLDSRPRCTYSDIEKLYNIRSELVHGKRKLSPEEARGQNLTDTHELEFVVAECMKKMLDERIYLKYADTAEKENYFNRMSKRPRQTGLS